MALFPPNLILYVPEGGTSLTYDRYGNPVESTPTGGMYLFSVTEDSPELRANAGLDTATATYTGRCVGKLGYEQSESGVVDTREKYLPGSVIPNVRLRCELIEPYQPEKRSDDVPQQESGFLAKTGKRHQGTFVVLSAFQSRYRVVTKVLGSKLQGYFELGR